MATVGTGAVLRQARLAQGHTLENIAGQTKISRRFLEAIELDAYDRLPGLLFTRNFIRQYAIFLKLDPEPLLDRVPKVDVDSAPLPDPANYARPSSQPRWIMAIWPGVKIAVGVAVVFGGYVFVERPKQFFPEANTPVAKAAPAPAPSPQPVAENASPAAAPPASATPEPQDSASAETRPVQVVLKARETSWVQIFADGRNDFTGVLQANDSRMIAADAQVRVTAGNAGGLDISLNGKSLDRLGSTGQVKTVRLTAQGLEILQKNTAPSRL